MSVLVKLFLGVAPAALTAIGWVVVRIRDRRMLRRSPELLAAIARHPSMHRRPAASYPMPCCREVIYGIDPLDLVAVQLVHESNCLAREVA